MAMCGWAPSFPFRSWPTGAAGPGGSCPLPAPEPHREEGGMWEPSREDRDPAGERAGVPRSCFWCPPKQRVPKGMCPQELSTPHADPSGVQGGGSGPHKAKHPAG